MDRKVVIPERVDRAVQIELEPLVTAGQIAPILQLKPQTVRDAAWRGKLPCIRLWAGKKKTLLRFKRSEIEAFIRDHTVPVSPRTGAARTKGGRAN